MKVDFKSLAPEWVSALAPYPPGMPLEELEREYGISDSIKLASNENPLGPSPKALAALQRALSTIHRYPDGGAYYLRRAVARRLGVSPAALIFGNGSNEVIELAVRAFLRRGEEAVMADQAFVIYRMVVAAAGGKARLVPLKDFTHDLEAMAAAVGPETKMVFIANPNNPTGTIVTRSAWKKFLGAIPPEVVVVMDEAYAGYVEDPDYPNSIENQAEGRPLLTLRTFSKIYGLAALRIGCGVADPEVIDLMDRVRQPFNVGTLAQVAAAAALEDAEHVARARQVNRAGMAYLKRELARLHLHWVPSWANFLLVEVGNGTGVYEGLLRYGVIVRPMDVYGFPAHIRVTVGTKAENERFIASLRCVVEKRRRREDAV